VKRLWAPWRIQYIKGPTPEGCIFCVLPRDGRDREHGIIYQGQRAFVILNTFPYNSAHVMVVPRRHVADLGALEDGDAIEMVHLTTAAMDAIRETYGAEGFNVGLNIGRAAGAGIVDHVHLHVVPRWVGDTNFMPVLGETKVLPEDLSVTYDRLAKALLEVLARRAPKPGVGSESSG
jgi:ATP adenylyltransferase